MDQCFRIHRVSAVAMRPLFSSIFSLLAVIGLRVSGQSSEQTIERTFVTLLTVPNGMFLGSWGQREFCPSQTYATGFSLKVEDPSDVLFDNTALNGIRLHCETLNKASSDPREDHVSVQSNTGRWGEWTNIQWCPSGFLTAFQLRVDPNKMFQDNTAANNIRFNCSGGSVLQGHGTNWGEWGDWSPPCGGRGMCGIMTRVEEPRGIGDDTALNNVGMYCCD